MKIRSAGDVESDDGAGEIVQEIAQLERAQRQLDADLALALGNRRLMIPLS